MPDPSEPSGNTGASAPPEPGAPFPKDAVDPELVRLGRARPTLSPVLAGSVLLFSGYMAITLWADLRFSRAGAPIAVSSLAPILAGDHDNDLVAVRVVPDKSLAAQVTRSEAGVGGLRVAPVLGSNDALWLAADGNPWTTPIGHDAMHEGRVRRLEDLPMDDPLREWVAAQPPAPRYASAAAVRAALEAGSPQVQHPAGGEIAITGNPEVAVVRSVPARATVRAWALEGRDSAAAWSLVLAHAGIAPAGARAFRESERAFWFDVPAPAGLEAVRRQLALAGLYAADVSAYTIEITTTWAGLEATPEGLEAGGQRVPWDQVSQVAITAPRRVPPDARIILTDEHPAAYWYLLPIYLGLIALAALFGWALARPLRPHADTA